MAIRKRKGKKKNKGKIKKTSGRVTFGGDLFAKVGSISLLDELKKRLTRSRIYQYREEERILNEITRPASWINAVCNSENVSPTHIWRINKERIYENYRGRFWKYIDKDGEYKQVDTKPKAEDLGDLDQYYKPIETIIMPNGKVITPIRQFCEHKVLPPGTREAFFYDFGSIRLGDINEGVEPKVNEQPIIRSNRAVLNARARGAGITVSYTQLEEPVEDLVMATNTAYALESIYDENREMLAKYDATILPKGRWINGNNGTVIKSDINLKDTDRLTLKGIMTAKRIIENEGLDTSNAILYTTGKAIRDLMLDPDFGAYISFSRPAIITQATIERVAGVRLVRSGSIPKTPETVTEEVPIKESYWNRLKRVLLFRKQPFNLVTKEVEKGVHSVLFLPSVSFGLVNGETITMEAQRRNELQAIKIVGTQRAVGVVKNMETTVRISHV